MYTGFNAKKQRKLSKVETLQAEVKHLRKLLSTMMHLHERLKNERIETGKTTELSTLPEGTSLNSKSVESSPPIVPTEPNNDPTNRKDQKGA